MEETTIHHVQVAMPEGGEEMARAFYREVLGFSEVPKPVSLEGRGGIWFQVGGLQLHLGVEQSFSPAKKAHVGYLAPSLDVAKAALAETGFPVVEDEDLPGFERFYTEDPFGNRVEILARTATSR